MRQKEKELGKEKNRAKREKDREEELLEKQKEKLEKELEKEKNREKEREKLEKELEKKKEKDNEKREGHLKAKEELDKEKERKELLKLKNKEEKQKQRDKEREEKEKLKEKEKEERNKLEEKNRKEREEKERQKQLEKQEKYKEKEEKEKQRLKEREEREKQKQKEKEEREKEKQKLIEERKKYNERFQNTSAKLNRRINGIITSPLTPKKTQQGTFYQRLAYKSNRLYHRRRNSHKRIQPKNRIPRLEPKKNLGKTTMKIIKPKRYDDDEEESEIEAKDFSEKLMKFPRFRAKYGKNYVIKNKTKFTTLTNSKYRGSKNSNMTISEIGEEEEKNNKNRVHKKGLSQVKPKRGIMDKKMREILGKHYKVLLDDPLNPYGTFWPSNFLKAGYDTGFEYDDFQSGVPVLKLKSLGKKQLPPIKKKGHENTNNNTPFKVTGANPFYSKTSAKKNLNEDIYDIKVNKSDNVQINNNKINNKEEEENVKLKNIDEESEL